MKYLFVLSVVMSLVNMGLALWGKDLSLAAAWVSSAMGWTIASIEFWSNS